MITNCNPEQAFLIPSSQRDLSRVGLKNNRTSSRGDEEDEYVEQYVMRIDIVLHCLSFLT